jgi:hypothetical protein
MALPIFDSNPDQFFMSLALRILAVIAALAMAGCEPRARNDADWGRHDAYQFCNAAIADYPQKPAPPCEAMHMCINEGALSAAETKKLYNMIAKAPNCPAP